MGKRCFASMLRSHQKKLLLCVPVVSHHRWASPSDSSHKFRACVSSKAAWQHQDVSPSCLCNFDSWSCDWAGDGHWGEAVLCEMPQWQSRCLHQDPAEVWCWRKSMSSTSGSSSKDKSSSPSIMTRTHYNQLSTSSCLVPTKNRIINFVEGKVLWFSPGSASISATMDFLF